MVATLPLLKVDDIASYLVAKGWHRDPREWHRSSVWSAGPGDYELLLPYRDGLGDGAARIRDILHCLASHEGRSPEEIAAEIAGPLLDSQFFRTRSGDHEPGYTSLVAGADAVAGVLTLLRVVARTTIQGPHYAFAGRYPDAVPEFLRGVELGPTRPGSYVIETRVPATPGGDVTGLAGRAVVSQMHEAVQAAHGSLLDGSITAFDDAVTAGVSANLCLALSAFSGDDHDSPFELDFRWAREVPYDQPSGVIAFPPAAGTLLRAAAERLRTGVDVNGPATVSGHVESLHDDAEGHDRWRVRVRGELVTDAGSSRRSVWVRLLTQQHYDHALTVHRERLPVRVRGELSTSPTGRVELVPSSDLEPFA